MAQYANELKKFRLVAVSHPISLPSLALFLSSTSVPPLCHLSFPLPGERSTNRNHKGATVTRLVLERLLVKVTWKIIMSFKFKRDITRVASQSDSLCKYLKLLARVRGYQEKAFGCEGHTVDGEEEGPRNGLLVDVHCPAKGANSHQWSVAVRLKILGQQF